MKNSVAVFSDELEARMVRDLLRSRGLDCEVSGSKEYLAHVTGERVGRYEVVVGDEDLEKARTLLEEHQKGFITASVLASESVSASASAAATSASPQKFLSDPSFGRAFLNAAGGILLLPIVFNYLSLRQGFRAWKVSEKKGIHHILLVAVILAQLPGLWALIWSWDLIHNTWLQMNEILSSTP